MTSDHIVVAIGGSAGSLEALTDLFDHIPLDHASYIILRHMPKGYHSQLKAILRKHSKLQLVNVDSSMPLHDNTVYIAPSDKDLELKGDKLVLVERSNNGPHLCVDRFFSSMANQGIGKRAIAVVLSGSGSDGTLGARAIKSAGGMVIAQDPLSCSFKYMPQHAIDSGSVNQIAIPSQIPSLIQAHVKSI